MLSEFNNAISDREKLISNTRQELASLISLRDDFKYLSEEDSNSESVSPKP